jgi:hypothetical protein
VILESELCGQTIKSRSQSMRNEPREDSEIEGDVRHVPKHRVELSGLLILLEDNTVRVSLTVRLKASIERLDLIVCDSNPEARTVHRVHWIAYYSEQ